LSFELSRLSISEPASSARSVIGSVIALFRSSFASRVIDVFYLEDATACRF
jgi:hypothetical protein